jgi:FixJ family two-component response regulator
MPTRLDSTSAEATPAAPVNATSGLKRRCPYHAAVMKMFVVTCPLLPHVAVEARLVPIIFLTGHGDIAMSVRAMKAGGVEFLTKPFRSQDLLDAIRAAIERDRVGRADRRELGALRTRYTSLTPRERDVLGGIVAGLLNSRSPAGA